MKIKLFFLSVLAFVFTFSSYSQLKVVSTGRVGIGTTTPGAKLEVSNTDPTIDHCAKFTGPSSLATVMIGGSSQNSYELYVSGDAYSTGGWQPSDEVYKKNIQVLNGNEVLTKLKKIDGKEYEYKSKSELESFFRNDVLDYVPHFSPGKHYGLIAQELEIEFPELVRLDSITMTKAINYDGMLPILLAAIKAQQQQIALMQEQINAVEDNCCQNNTKSGSIGETEKTELNGALPKLFQNAPNPFSTQTTIRYEIPETVQSAHLHICNMTGTLLKTISVNQKGTGSVIISANEFIAGMYLYSLVCDGKIADTKQMLLTE